MFVDSSTGNVTGGIEAKMAMEFAKKYDLKMKWFDAKYVWGAFVEETQRFITCCIKKILKESF